MRIKNFITPAVVFIPQENSIYPYLLVVDPDNTVAPLTQRIQAFSRTSLDDLLHILIYDHPHVALYVFLKGNVIFLQRDILATIAPQWHLQKEESTITLQFHCGSEDAPSTRCIPFGVRFIIDTHTKVISATGIMCNAQRLLPLIGPFGALIKRRGLAAFLKKHVSFAYTTKLTFTRETKAEFFEWIGLLLHCGVPVSKDGKPVVQHDIALLVDISEDTAGNFLITPQDAVWRTLITSSELWHETAHEVTMLTEATEEQLQTIRMLYHEYPKSVAKDNGISFVIPRSHIFVLFLLYQQNLLNNSSEHYKVLVDALYDFENISQAPVPKKIKATLHDYQQKGFDWLFFLYKHRLGACLADEMGLGKTVQTITFLASVHEEVIAQSGAKPQHLIVAPVSLINNWAEEIKKFYPSCVTYLYTGSDRKLPDSSVDIVITTYDTVRQDYELLQKVSWHVVVCDEAQALKNSKSQRAEALVEVDAVFKLCVTGTPLENNMHELCSIINFVAPKLIAEHEIDNPETTVSLLSHKLQPFLLRRTKAEHLQHLPGKKERNVFLKMSDEQRTLYAAIVRGVKKEVLKSYKEKTVAQASVIALTALLRLRQVCVSPALVDPTQDPFSPKMLYLLREIQAKQAEHIPVLVFSQFTGALDIIVQLLEQQGISYLRIDGTISADERKRIVKQFQESTTLFVLLLSLKTGGVGLTLTRARVVYHLDPWWNPAVENQASDRVHRIGQVHEVTIIRIVMQNSVEQKMLLLQQKKKELFDVIMTGAAGVKSSTLTKDDFDFLLT